MASLLDQVLAISAKQERSFSAPEEGEDARFEFALSPLSRWGSACIWAVKCMLPSSSVATQVLHTDSDVAAFLSEIPPSLPHRLPALCDSLRGTYAMGSRSTLRYLTREFGRDGGWDDAEHDELLELADEMRNLLDADGSTGPEGAPSASSGAG